MDRYSCRYELERWGEFQVRTIEGLGYSASSPLSWAIEGRSRVPWAAGKLPIGLNTKGLEEYLLVERALSALDQEYRVVALTEYAAPIALVGKSMAKRALRTGVTLSAYRRRLKRIHEEIHRIYDN